MSCPNCHCPDCNPGLAPRPPVNEPDADVLSAIARRQIRAECERLGIAVTWDNRVGTSGAAKLIGKSAKTLQKWREQGVGPRYRKAGGRSAHVEYDLHEIARYRPAIFDRLA